MWAELIVILVNVNSIRRIVAFSIGNTEPFFGVTNVAAHYGTNAQELSLMSIVCMQRVRYFLKISYTDQPSLPEFRNSSFTFPWNDIGAA